MEHRVRSKVDTRQVRRQMLFVLADAPPVLTAGCDTSFTCRNSSHNTDVSLIKNVQAGRGVGLQIRADVFDLFNHPNLGPPGNVVGSPTFGTITRTLLPTGEAGSSRQIQFAARLSF
jgi:hypothetical protein